MSRTLAIAAVAALIALPLGAQHRPLDPPSTLDQNHRTRLILKDGGYQLVLTWKIDGGIVRYRSAERGGAVEEIPLNLIDVAATKKWEAEHAAGETGAPQRTVTLSPELRKEEAERAARTPEVAPNLKLPDEDSMLALDEFRGTAELVPLNQNGGDLNKQTAHNMLRATLNPFASAHQIVEIKGERADVQLHVPDPALFVRIARKDDDSAVAVANAMTVDTHGGGRETPSGGSAKSDYVIVRTDVRKGVRVVSSFSINLLGGVKRQQDVIETTVTLLPGGHWLQLKPKQPLEFGEYALIEVVGEKEVNLDVWDFGIHPDAQENADAILPDVRSSAPPSLSRRKPE